MRLLLHACCGPCSLEPSRILQEQGHELTIYFANSNIAPAEEYAHRLETLRTWAGDAGIAVQEGDYDPDAWQRTAGRIGDAALAEAREGLLDQEKEHLRDEAASCVPGKAALTDEAPGAAHGDGEQAAQVAPASAERADSPDKSAAHPAQPDPNAPAVRFGKFGELTLEEAAALSVDPEKRAARCRACYRLRLEETARQAADQGFDGIATTLSVSPYQYTDIIQEELQRAAALAGIQAVFEDFRPNYPEATRRSRDLGMYRQNYCGCMISDTEAAAERAERKAERKAQHAAERAAHAEERSAEEAMRAEKKAERAAYDAKQARKRAVLKALRKQRKQAEA